MPTHTVNLDALILREDFEHVSKEAHGKNLSDIKIRELRADEPTFKALRKPDFQRETNSWKPEAIAVLIRSFLDEELIPALVLWNSPTSGNVFVIDGAHRLSALIAWVHDDYGDGPLSRAFFEVIPEEQLQSAEQARQKVKATIGTFKDLFAAGDEEITDELLLRRSKHAAVNAIPCQWVQGDAALAERSFFQINQRAVPIHKQEIKIIQARKQPGAIAARALLHAGSGHKYWSAFSDSNQERIKLLARQIHETLFRPALKDPVKSLELPIAGRGYSSDGLSLAFDFVNLVNETESTEKDEDGNRTIEHLERVWTITRKVRGLYPESLGLHPAVYFYSATGRYQPAAFLAMVRFIRDMGAKDAYLSFTEHRYEFEEFLLEHRHFINQVVSKLGAGLRSLDRLYTLYRDAFTLIKNGTSRDKVAEELTLEKQFSFLDTEEFDRQGGKRFSKETQSAVYLREALERAVRCGICRARIDSASMTIDHIVRAEDGGLGVPDNGQVAHPYCNTGYKEHKESITRNRREQTGC